jgi:hypothetical protein
MRDLFRPEIAIHSGALNLNWLYTLFVEPKIAIQLLFPEPVTAIHRWAASLKWLYSPRIRAEGRDVAQRFLGYA